MILLFCLALIGVIGSAQLLNGLVLRLQDGFTHGSGILVRMTRGLGSAETVIWSADLWFP